MSQIHTTQSNPIGETHLKREQFKNFGYRYAYARSIDSQESHSPGQDYFVIQHDPETIVFVICDGVSQSFIGELAASYLGNELVGWLWDQKDSSDPVAFQKALAQFLNSLPPLATEIVRGYQLPSDLPLMVRDVLEEKRTLGSQSMFICGIVDTRSNQAFFAWAGDMCLRVWGLMGELPTFSREYFSTEERWSTKTGVIGAVHVANIEISKMQAVVAYSDGLEILNDQAVPALTNEELDRLIFEDNDFIDDGSLIEIWLGASPLAKRASFLQAPQNLSVQYADPLVIVHWDPVDGEVQYEAQFEPGKTRNLGSDTNWQFHISNIPANSSYVHLRALKNDQVSAWKKVKLPDFTPKQVVSTPVGIPLHPPARSERKLTWLVPIGLLTGLLIILGIIVFPKITNHLWRFGGETDATLLPTHTVINTQPARVDAPTSTMVPAVQAPTLTDTAMPAATMTPASRAGITPTNTETRHTSTPPSLQATNQPTEASTLESPTPTSSLRDLVQ